MNGEKMKRLCIAIVLFGSSHSLALAEDQIVKLQNPVHPSLGIPFSAGNPTEIDGVCKALGYQNYIFDSARRSKEVVDVVQVNFDGITISNPKHNPIVEIWCSGSLTPPSDPGFTVIPQPIHKEVGLPFAAWQNQDFQGVCKYLGFSSYLDDSARRNKSLEDTVLVDEQGNLNNARASSYRLVTLTCY
ncbi:MAG: hypothetical protein KA715_13085 [Xanthomonadaceae bacterium]|nr:hypothetical protein [Xanthomonadaceae bacterium]